MKCIFLTIMTAILIIGWHENLLAGFPLIVDSTVNAPLSDRKQVKCMTEDGRFLYGTVPLGTVCKRQEVIKDRLTIVPSLPIAPSTPKDSSINNNNKHRASGFKRASRFKCDGRQHCSQMRSRAEAEFFLRNCPDPKMDGDYDGKPCENYRF